MNTYTKKERNMYLLGLLGQNMIYNIIASGMAFYFRSVIFTPAMAISILMGVARVWDAINDPMMGTIVDKTRSKWGKCRPYLFHVPSAVLIVTVLTFVNGQYSASNPASKNVLIIGWAAVSYILWGMTYTAGDIPLWGITSLMTESNKDREKLLSLARIVAAIGGAAVMFSVVPPVPDCWRHVHRRRHESEGWPPVGLYRGLRHYEPGGLWTVPVRCLCQGAGLPTLR